MAWKAMEVHEQWVKFVVAARRRDKPLRTLCAEFGIIVSDRLPLSS